MLCGGVITKDQLFDDFSCAWIACAFVVANENQSVFIYSL